MAAASIMSLVAQAFVEKNAFEMTASHSNSPRTAAAFYARDSPRRQRLHEQQQQQTTPQKTGPSPKRRTPAKSPRGADGRSPEDVHSWSDATLAEKYQFIEEIGYGNWGSVWKVKPKLEGPDASTRSVKLVHRSKNPTSSARVRALWTEFKCIRALRSAPHPNLISFREFIITPSYAIVTMPFHPRLMPVALPESKAKIYFRQLLSAVEHLHSHGIAHNDIKPSNILLSADDQPILIDYGFSTSYSLTSPDRFLSSLSWGTPEYLSPERAKGMLHDERLSDVWALGITMYEIVVGRTPFEQSEEENFLNREQLEVYYNRTLTGKFFGSYVVSSEFENLIHLMVEPNAGTRIQSSSSNACTPTRTVVRKPGSLVQTPSSTTQTVATPRKTPKNDDRKKGFTFFQDTEQPRPARTGDSQSPFSPRRPVLTNRSNQHSPAPAVPSTSIAKPDPSTPKPYTIKKTPPPSKIPIRKGDIGSPVPLVKSPRTGAILGHHRLVSSPTIPLRVVSDQQPPVPQVPSENEVDRLSRSASLKSIKRKPVPTFDEIAFVKALPKSQLTTDGDSSDDEGEEVLASSRTSPVPARKGSLGESVPTTLDKSSGFTSRSYTIKVGSKKSKLSSEGPTSLSNLSEVFTSDLPRLSRKSSSAIATRIRKLPAKNIRRAPSAMSFAGLKNPLTGAGIRRRASLADSVYDMVEAERLDDDRNALTLPLELATRPAAEGAEAHRARLHSFSRHIQHILDTRKPEESLPSSEPATPLSSTFSSASSSVHDSSKKLALMQPVLEAHEPSPEPFSFNGTSSLSPVQATSVSSPPHRKSILRMGSPGRTFGSSITSPKSRPSPPKKDNFKRGHRRIPTAIRNVPSVVLHESADDGDCAESDYSRSDTPFERVASPPTAPRVVEPSRMLPTWVPTDPSDEGSEGDVDEPTVTISSPLKLKHKPSHSSAFGKNATPKSSPFKSGYSSICTMPVTLDEQRVSRPIFHRGDTVASTSLLDGTATRPPSPSVAALPFTNFDTRAASRASTNSSAASSPRKLGHKRSRSVLSFFFRSSITDGEAPASEKDRSMSRMSNTSSLEWSTTSDAPRLPRLDPTREGQGKKRGGRLRRVVSKVFG
ncbi:hypothetical protein JCM11641_001243 [Rhodosporidiobolus odoratus]